MSEREVQPLSRFIRVKHGFAFPGAEFSEDPSLPTLVTPGNFAIGGGFKGTKTKTFAGDYPAEYKLRAGDLIVSMTDLSKDGDTLGLPAVVPKGDYLHNQRIGLVEITDPEAVDARFLNYFLRTEDYRSYILGTASGSTVRHTSPARISAFETSLPTLGEQRAIAEVLGALDDKIAANTKLAITADEWVRACLAGLTASAKETMPVSELVVNRKELAEPSTLGPASKYLGLEHLPRRSMWASSAGTAESVMSTKAKFQRGDILFGKLRPYFHKVIVAPFDGVCSTDILVLNPSNQELAGFTLASVASDLVVERATAASEGTRMPRTSWKDLASIEVPWPGMTEAKKFSARVSEMRGSVEALLGENQTLAATRDALLPQLMSDKLRVKDAGRVLENAGV